MKKAGCKKKYEGHLESYFYEGSLNNRIASVYYHSYYGKKRGEEIVSFLEFYPDFFEQLFQDRLKAINIYEKTPSSGKTTLNIPCRKVPYEEEELLKMFVAFVSEPVEEEKGYQKVYRS